MISSISKEYEESFKLLGLQVNNNFNNLFNLNDINANEDNYLYGYFVDNILVGFIHVIKLIDELEIINIVVDKEYRGRGIGKELLTFIINSFDDIKNIFLEVSDKNDIAIKLYESNGFSIINVRKNYYKDSDALIMRKDV